MEKIDVSHLALKDEIMFVSISLNNYVRNNLESFSRIYFNWWFLDKETIKYNLFRSYLLDSWEDKIGNNFI